jgi:rhodanese-related sulfurtransferase
MAGYKTITPTELKERLDRGEAIQIIDVRELREFEVARIEGAKLLPLSSFNNWAPGLNPDDEMVIMCHHGIRSAQVCSFFASHGFTKLLNLEGGIDQWSRDVDPEVPLY